MQLASSDSVRPPDLRTEILKYAGLETSDLVRLKQLEVENAQMRRIIARKELELDALSARRAASSASQQLGTHERISCDRPCGS